MSQLPTLFTAIIAALRVAIGTHVGRHPAQAPLLNHACDYLSRAMQRFQRLFARWRAGTPIRARTARPRHPAAPRTTPRFPTANAWLTARVGYTAAGHGSQLQYLLATPEAADFIREVPQAGRLLRPLCHMLGIAPAPLGLALPPAPPRPRRIRQRRPPPPEPATPYRPLPAYVRAAVRAWKPKRARRPEPA
ncbi:MAG: hypothetical protein IT555_17665 [Acetobacteraceae bacterium]|nr:hypothetical protein [Acetobacteraceae bacterium]